MQAALAAGFVVLLSAGIFASRDTGPSYTVRTPISPLEDAQSKEQVSEFEADAEAAEQAVTGTAASPPQLDWAGLAGEGFSTGAPAHKVTISVTSEAPAGTVGYVIPTSVDDYAGKVTAGTTWSLTTTAYGRPDYARVFIQAGARGYPVTCTVIVDGKVTDRRSTAGPWGQSMCQG